MKKTVFTLILLCLLMCCAGCHTAQTNCNGGDNGTSGNISQGSERENTAQQSIDEYYTVNSKITDVINDPVFEEYGRLIFPVDSSYYSGDTLGELQLTWYSHIDPQETVDIVNDLKTRASAGQPVFFDIYTEEEKAADPDKEDTGLFYFPGRQGATFALCSAGGGFAYVGAMQDSLPHALALSQHGYHAFALIYRPGAQSGCEDLARAISFVNSHAE